MTKHARYGVTAEHIGADMFVTAHSLCEDPLSLAGEKAAQLHALLFMTHDSTEQLGNLCAEVHGNLLSLAVGLAHEALVLSELAAQRLKEARRGA
jgi:hypothetical protein